MFYQTCIIPHCIRIVLHCIKVNHVGSQKSRHGCRGHAALNTVRYSRNNLSAAYRYGEMINGRYYPCDTRIPGWSEIVTLYARDSLHRSSRLRYDAVETFKLSLHTIYTREAIVKHFLITHTRFPSIYSRACRFAL